MAEEGKNKVADSLLDLQPTAILELFRVFPDKVNKPTLFLGFHAGTVFDKSLIWQGVQYLPLSMECEGFDIFGDGKLARPKLRILNKDYIINESDYLSIPLGDKQAPLEPFKSQTALPPTPGVNQELVAQATPDITQTGLTHTENALLSNEEKAMRLRQRGMA